MTSAEREKLLRSLPSLMAINAERARRSLHEFVRQAWPVIEPGQPFVDGWHIDAICKHLEAVTFGKIRRLAINIQPRSSKSTLVSICWPAWEWITFPSTKWLFVSYAQDLSFEHSMACRRLIEHKWYQDRWGPGSYWAQSSGKDKVFSLRGDRNTQGMFANTLNGSRMASSVDAKNTGFGANRIIADDSNDLRESDNEAALKTVRDWWSGVMQTRANDPKRDSFVIIQQRCNALDLTGYVLGNSGLMPYEHLCIPARYDGSDLIEAT